MPPTPRDPDAGARDAALRDETKKSWPVFGSALLSPGQTRGGAIGTGLVAVAGLVVGTLIGLIPFLGLDLLARVLICGGVGLVTGATVGALIGGGLGPDAAGETGSLPGEARLTRSQRRAGRAQ